MLSRRLSSVVCSVALAGCASAPSRGPGERGLAELREALELAPVVGHVERVGGQTRLVHDKTGSVIALAPTPNADAPCSKTRGQSTLMFEGDPGAALTFDIGVATLWQSHPDDDCAVAIDVFAIAEPAWTPLAELGPNGNHTRATVPIAGAEPVVVAITPKGASVSHGSEQIAVDFPAEERCALVAKAEQAARGDGVTWLRVSYTIDSNLDFDTCEDALEYASAETQSTGSTWLEIARDGRIRVVAREDSPPEHRDMEGHRWHSFDVPGGVVEYDEVSTHQLVREGPSVIYSWTWTLVIGETRVVLAQGAE